MHPKMYLTSFCALCSVSLLMGCSSTMVADPFPSDVPKGYVEFYIGNPESADFLPDIYKLQDQKEIYYFHSALFPTTKVRQRIACKPGQHTFVIKKGNAAERIQVEIKQDEITPIKIIIVTLHRESLSYTTKYYFNMSVHSEKPVPIPKGMSGKTYLLPNT